MSRPIVFLSDFGLDDEFVGVCHGVLASLAPDARVIDLTHGIPPGDVLRGALVLQRSAPFMPADAVYLAVVDPGVGTARRPVAVRTGSGALFVGPDNGLLIHAVNDLGGIDEARIIESPGVILAPTSATFHGRDVFAPSAAHLANGRPIEELGPPAGDVEWIAIEGRSLAAGVVRAPVIAVDRFGNVEVGASTVDLAETGLLGSPTLSAELPSHPEGAVELPFVRTFGDVGAGEAGVLIDSSGWLTIFVRQDSAAERFGLREGGGVIVRRPDALMEEG